MEPPINITNKFILVRIRDMSDGTIYYDYDENKTRYSYDIFNIHDTKGIEKTKQRFQDFINHFHLEKEFEVQTINVNDFLVNAAL